jgi:hypothetical protein
MGSLMRQRFFRFTYLTILGLFIIACNQQGTFDSPNTNLYNLPLTPNVSDDTPILWNLRSSSNSLDLHISDNFNENEKNAILSMMLNWDDALPDINFFSYGDDPIINLDSPNLDDYRDGTLGIYKSYQWSSSLSADTLAITQFFGIRRNAGTENEFIEITHGDIVLNYRDHHFSETPSGGEYDLSTVVLHELGHFLGLRHEFSWSIPSVMQPSIAIWSTERDLYPRDEQVLTDLYSLMDFLPLSLVKNVQKYAYAPQNEVRIILELKKDGHCKRQHWK